MTGPCRPGGLALTGQLLEGCAFAPGARVLDLGCGGGSTVRHLRERGLEGWGLDRDRAALAGSGPFLCARAERLPFAPGSLDGVLLECSLSVMEDPGRVLDQCRLVLRPGGSLGLTDLYARGRPAHLGGCLGRVDSREALLGGLEAHGFLPARFEDCSELLRAYWGQRVLDLGASRALAGADAGALRAARAGYCLILARREDRT